MFLLVLLVVEWLPRPTLDALRSCVGFGEKSSRKTVSG
jgi:hypothetical protein